ncbi:MAG: thioredoxin domain-containing protein [Ornithinimicrobium sp.]|uniref:DsbA family protein n=1 Tax=Ornithinimicrobium sp. TaxID=1977084 RepID=UPI0026DF26ED|nr:thioredoxin domain-containing protein [Ornithinimicrobium sp.]MDO5738708.1 thioredoxin domain-containing protein [Ornithinimicrobium sp.]
MPRPPAPPVKPAPTGPSLILIGGVVVLAVALIAVLVWTATRGGDLDAQGSTSTLSDGGGISVGAGADADAATGSDVFQIRVYEDFQCPWCGRLEASIGEALTTKAKSGEVTVTYQIMSFLDGGLGNDSSSRAANAALCADDAGAFVPFHAAVYAHQPAQEGAGYTDAQFLTWGKDVGLSGSALDTFTSCVSSGTHLDYVDDMQQRANKDGVTGTPTVVVNGDTLDNDELSKLLETPSSLDAILEAHRGRP